MVRFKTKMAQKPTRWGGTYLYYSLSKGVPPPPRAVLHSPGRSCSESGTFLVDVHAGLDNDNNTVSRSQLVSISF